MTADLQARIVETVGRMGRPHVSEVRRELGIDPIEFGFALHDLVDARVLDTDNSGMLPRCWIAGGESSPTEETRT